MEDFGGVSLRTYCGSNQTLAAGETQSTSIKIGEFIEIAIEIVKILDELHSRQIIHKDIKPDNILIHPVSQQIKLIDFSISSLLLRENQEIQNSQVLVSLIKKITSQSRAKRRSGMGHGKDFQSLLLWSFHSRIVILKPRDCLTPINCDRSRPIVPMQPETI